jgi:pyruvate dehydrogenase E2 component (dihydrolipoamide acetyltransferase)
VAEIKQVLVPDIGDYRDVDIIEVMVKAGQTINAEDNLITLETDKAAMDVPSPYAGVIKEVNVKVGDKVSQGSLILLLESSDAGTPQKSKSVQLPPVPTVAPVTEKVEAKPSAATDAASSSLPAMAQPVTSAKAHASPAIRRFARELGVQIEQVKGSGEKGRITKDDVQLFVKTALAQSGTSTGNGLQVLAMPVVDYAKYGAIETRPLSRIKKISGANLHRNWVTIPHITQFDEADITEMEAFRKELNVEYAKQKIKITPLAFMLKAVVVALQEFPEFNASLDNSGENLVLKKYFHIGVAVDTPNGLMVPVLRDVDKKGIIQLARELGEISAKARELKITAAEMQGGCFSISSLGGIGGTAFTPIINAPELAILGVSKAIIKPMHQDDTFVARLMLPLSLSYDHRVIDGAAAARFIVFLSQVLADTRRLAL